MVTQILELLMDRRSKMCENETQMSDSHEFILILNFMVFLDHYSYIDIWLANYALHIWGKVEYNIQYVGWEFWGPMGCGWG